jgi:PBSX family phage terminase large subunit
METQTPPSQKAIDALVKTAYEAGAPADQVQQLVSHGYVPLPWQWDFHAAAREADLETGPDLIGAGGARGPGKSHAVFSQVTLDDSQRVAGLKGLFLRQTGLSAQESFEDLIEKVLRGKVPYTYKNNMLRFGNRSRLLLGGFHNAKDIDKYIGIEYDYIVIEEMNQLTKEKIEKIRGSVRTSKPNWRPRVYSSFNPGGVGHGYLKETFVEPYRKGEEHRTRFIPATYKENPHLNSGYIEYLEGLTGDLGRAWREGEWDLFAGQYFSEWRHDIHVIQPFAIPTDWKRFVMGDYGYKNPSAVYWGAISPDDIIYIYRELYTTERTYQELCKDIVSMTNDDEVISYWVFDPAIWARDGKSIAGLSGADIIEQEFKRLTGKTLRLIRGDNDRIDGWNALRQRLKPRVSADGGVTAGIVFFSTCHNFIRTLPNLIHDEHRPEDLDTTGEDHGPDAVRYGVKSNPTRSKTAEEVKEMHFRKQMAMKKKRGIIPKIYPRNP